MPSFKTSLRKPPEDANLQDEARQNHHLGPFPTEIWHIVCGHLHRDVDALSALRLTGRGLADVAGELLISSIRIDTDLESLKRLQYIANHELLRKGVRILTFEGGLLDEICIHGYTRHYDMEHHRAEKPSPPAKESMSDRSGRLYVRNLAKYERELQSRFEAYQALLKAQQAVVNAISKPTTKTREDPFNMCLYIQLLPNLTEVRLNTAASCPHAMSSQFREKFVADCAIPISTDSADSVWQLENILRPGLRRLEVRQVSPRFFDGTGQRSAIWLESIFVSLEDLHLRFGQERDFEFSDTSGDKMLDNMQLAATLTMSKSLKSLTVNFNPAQLSDGSAATLDQIMGNTSFSELRDLDLSFVSATEEGIVQVLRSQPKLRGLSFAFMVLSEGTWASTVKRMRSDLQLEYFIAAGLLEDTERVIQTDLYDLSLWSDGTRWPLSTALDLYVCQTDYPYTEEEFLRDYGTDADFDEFWNPINRIDDEFEEEENLEYEFGPIVDSDDEEESDIDINMSEDGDCSEDPDDELPALVNATIPMDVD